MPLPPPVVARNGVGENNPFFTWLSLLIHAAGPRAIPCSTGGLLLGGL